MKKRNEKTKENLDFISKEFLTVKNIMSDSQNLLKSSVHYLHEFEENSKKNSEKYLKILKTKKKVNQNLQIFIKTKEEKIFNLLHEKADRLKKKKRLESQILELTQNNREQNKKLENLLFDHKTGFN